MFQTGGVSTGTQTSLRTGTTLLAGCWGFAFSYSCFRCLFSAECPRNFFIAMIPLIAVWATLERKRWGRLALLGLSLMTVTLFLLCLVLLLAGRSEMPSAAMLHLADAVPQALVLFSDYPKTALMILILAITSLLYLAQPAVKEEFEKGKQNFLKTGQRVIAVSLVLLWSLLVLLTPPMAASRPNAPAALKTNKVSPRL